METTNFRRMIFTVNNDSHQQWIPRSSAIKKKKENKIQSERENERECDRRENYFLHTFRRRKSNIKKKNLVIALCSANKKRLINKIETHVKLTDCANITGVWANKLLSCTNRAESFYHDKWLLIYIENLRLINKVYAAARCVSLKFYCYFTLV